MNAKPDYLAHGFRVGDELALRFCRVPRWCPRWVFRIWRRFVAEKPRRLVVTECSATTLTMALQPPPVR